MEEQTALYAQGREDIAAVNALRRLAGMPPIEAEANRIVTYARPGYSNLLVICFCLISMHCLISRTFLRQPETLDVDIQRSIGLYCNHRNWVLSFNVS